MKSIYLSISFLILMTGLTLAQIPNASFETWSLGNPDNWTTNNNSDYTWITQDNSAHAGSSAAKSSVLSFMDIPMASPLALGQEGHGAHINTAPDAIHGWYILNSGGGDFMTATAGVVNTQGSGGVGQQEVTTPTSTYKEFIVNIQYLSGVPNGDSLLLSFDIFGDTSFSTIHFGTYFIVDDLSFGAQGTTAIGDVNAYNNSIEKIYPAPSNALTNIVYTVSETQNVKVEIINALGQVVKQVLSENQTPGRYKAQTDNDNLPSGMYYVKLTVGSKQSVMPMVVAN